MFCGIVVERTKKMNIKALSWPFHTTNSQQLHKNINILWKNEIQVKRNEKEK